MTTTQTRVRIVTKNRTRTTGKFSVYRGDVLLGTFTSRRDAEDEAIRLQSAS